MKRHKPTNTELDWKIAVHEGLIQWLRAEKKRLTYWIAIMQRELKDLKNQREA